MYQVSCYALTPYISLPEIQRFTVLKIMRLHRFPSKSNFKDFFCLHIDCIPGDFVDRLMDASNFTVVAQGVAIFKITCFTAQNGGHLDVHVGMESTEL